jgi:hypothetical protein
MLQALIAIVSMTAGNFLYHALTDTDWAAAFEQSYFQAAGVLMYAAVSTLFLVPG